MTEQKLYSHQKEVLNILKRGQHCFALLPTGSGKSLCYEWPALHWGWRVLVVSPLIALMEDQAMSMQAQGLSVARLHSALNFETAKEEFEKIRSGDARLVFISPERLLVWYETGLLAKLQAKEKFSLLAIDELHCAIDWSEFRAAYERIAHPVQALVSEGSSVLGLSASLTVEAADRLFAKWGLQPEKVFRPLGRDNLQQFVFPLEESAERYLLLAALLRNLSAPKTAIIYCETREQTEQLKDFLEAIQIPTSVFHAGLPPMIRQQRVADFRAGRLRVICASTAFGMGVDYPHVERVIHFGLPYDYTAYWQAIGRAGRGGHPAFGFVLWCRSDALRLRSFSARQKKEARSLWHGLLEERCRKILVAAHFGLPQENCGACDVCWREKQFSLPSFLPDPQYFLRRRPWWLESRTDTAGWLEENFFYS